MRRLSRKSFVKGRSTDSLLNMSLREFAGLAKTQLRQVVSRLADTANKRFARVSGSKYESLAARQVVESGGKFSTRGKGLEELQAEYMRVRDFLKSPTSTIKGARAAENEAIKTIKDIYGDDLTGVDIRSLIDDYYKLQNYDEEYQAQRLRYGFLYDKPVEQYVGEEKYDIKRLSRRLIAILNKNLAPGGNGYDGVSQWFDID